MFSRFFIDRPIFAAVLSIVITLAGGIALFSLPLAQFPAIAPPTVQIDCNYPGASAQVVAEAVAAPIEQQVNGVENMLYMASQCTNDGSYNLAVTFQHGVDLDMAQVLVQNRVNLALPALPDVIKQIGVTTRKRSPDILMSVNLNSPDRSYDQLYLSNYALMHIRDELLRVPGVGEVIITGQRDYSMRIWVDPQKLAVRNLAAIDVVRAVREQNAQLATGQIGQDPIQPGQECQITLTTLGRLEEPEQFEDIIIRSTGDGRLVRLKDVARVELGARNQDVRCRLDTKPSVGMVIFQLPGANALETADRVHAKVKALEQDFPKAVHGELDPDAPKAMKCEIQYDTTPYTRESIANVFKTLREAIILVAVVVLLFLQNWRSAIIPLVAVPVAIIGTFAVMAAFGFSLNNLTLFGLVLAIGIVVDDAIVVVEATEHHIELGLAPRDATIKAMSQVSGPVIAVGLVLSAVFVPCAFISGITGQFFRQFALTIATSTVISAFNSLTLSPALASILLRSRDKETHEPLPRLAISALLGWLGYQLLTGELAEPLRELVLGGLSPAAAEAVLPALPWVSAAAVAVAGWFASRFLNRILRGGFTLFDRGFHGSLALYTRTVGLLLRVSLLVLVVYGGLLGLTWWSFRRLPVGFIPTADMGYLLINVQTPDATSAERTREVMDKADEMLLGTPGKDPDSPEYKPPASGVKHTLNIAGNSFLLSAYGSNFGSFFCILDDFANRLTPELYSEEIAARLRQRFAAEVPEATVSVFGAPPVRGVGRSGGFKIMIEDRGDLGLQNLQEQAENLMRKGNQLRRFKLTDDTLAALREDGVPAEVVEALASLKDQSLDTEMSFPDALDKLLTAEQLQQHKANLLRLVKISGYQLAAENLTTLRRQGVVDQIQLTANGLATLRKQGVPDEVVAAWKLLQDQVYPSEMNLRQALAERLPEAVTAELWKRYQDLTVHAALRKPGDTDRYQLAEGTFVALHKQKVPDEIVAAWKRLQGKEYPSEESLREALARVSKSAVAGLLRRYQALAVDAAEVAIIEALKTLRDKPYRSEARWRAALAEHLSAEQRDRFADAIVDAAKQEVPAPLVGLFNVFRANSPQLYADVDRTQCMKMGVLLPEAFGTLQTYLGSLHVNDFNRFGRTWQVNVQADARFRNQVEAVSQLKVRNNRGQMVPLGAVATLRQISGPFILTRYNMYPAAGIAGNAATGVSSGDAIALMERLARHELPPSMTFEWTEMAFLELQAGNTAMIIFAFAVLMVFLVLAAQYESWSLPLAVILVVPMCLLSATTGVSLAHMDINIFTQIGFVVLVGLASKNAILIVEFAKREREAGVPRREAALAACKLRLRPIMMTSFAFILGVTPLLFARGAGAEMRRTLGTAVFSGMLGVTLFGIFLTPAFFVVVDRVSQTRLFSSRFMRWLGNFSLAVLVVALLGFVWGALLWGGVRLLAWLARVGDRVANRKRKDDSSDGS